MTEHASEPFSFDDIIGNLSGEMRDPVGDEIKQVITLLQQHMDSYGPMTEAEADRFISEGNAMLHDIEGEEVFVTGKAYLYRSAEEEADRIAAGSDVGYEAFRPEHAIQEDEDDPYFLLSRQRCRFDTLSASPYVDEIDDEETDKTTFQVTCQLTVLRDDQMRYPSAQGLDIAVVAEDLVAIEPLTPSLAKRANELLAYHPDITAQLDTLPSDIFDDKDGLSELREFRLTLDQSRYPYNRPDQLAAILQTVSDLIRDRFYDDDSMYKVRHRGQRLGLTSTGEYISSIAEQKETLYGTLVDMRLQNTDPEPDANGVNTYEIAFIFSAPGPGFRDGDNVLILPIRSVRKMTPIRNKVFFESDVLQVPARSGPSPVLSGVDYDAGNETPGSAEPSVVTIRTNPEIRATRSEELLAEYKESFTRLWQSIRERCGSVFTSAEEAGEVQRAVRAELAEFCQHYIDVLLTTDMEFSGYAVEYVEAMPGISEAAKRGEVPVLDFGNIPLQSGDALTVRHGNNTGKIDVILQSHDDMQGGVVHTVTPFMYFHDKSDGAAFGVSPQGADFDTPIYNVLIRTQFALRMTGDGSVEIPALLRMRRCREVIDRIAAEQPDATFLPAYLTDLKELVDNEDPEAFTDIDIRYLRAISESIVGSDVASSLTSEALSAIFGNRDVDLTGTTYKETKLMPARRIQGELVDIIDSAPGLDTKEPMLVVDGDDDETYYLPLAGVERLRV